MTALPPVPSTILIKLIQTDDSDANVETLLYFKYSGSVSAVDLTTLCNNVLTAWHTNVAPNLGNWFTLQEVMGNDLNSTTGAQATNTNGTATGAQLNDHRLSSAAAFVIRNDGSYKYRGGHSRNYLGGCPSEGLSNSNTWSSAFQQTMLTAWNNFIGAVISTAVPAAMGTLTHVIAHRFGKTATSPVATGIASRSVPLTAPWTEDVTGYATNPNVASQRRRNEQVA